MLLAARLTPWKGQKVLIRAAQVLRERGYRDLVFVLAGDPQGRDGYVTEIDRSLPRTSWAAWCAAWGMSRICRQHSRPRHS